MCNWCVVKHDWRLGEARGWLVGWSLGGKVVSLYGPRPAQVPSSLPEPHGASQRFPKGPGPKPHQRLPWHPLWLDIATYQLGIYHIIGQTSHVHEPFRSHTLAMDGTQSNTILTRPQPGVSQARPMSCESSIDAWWMLCESLVNAGWLGTKWD